MEQTLEERHASVREQLKTQTRTTVSVPDAALACGVSPHRLYQWIREGREVLPGVRAIRVGEHKIVVPALPLARALGLLDEED